jgi:ketosteroid isomerase-like protein
MGCAENLEVVRRFYAAGPADDDTGRDAFAVPDVVWHVPGDNPVAGRYEGHVEVFETMGERMQPLETWTIDVETMMANDDLVMAELHVVGARGAQRVDCRGGHVFRFAPDGRIAEVWGFVEDQAALDELFASR